MNAFLTLTSEGKTILVNYFNALSFTESGESGEKTIVLLAAGTRVTVDQSLADIGAMIQKKAVWDK